MKSKFHHIILSIALLFLVTGVQAILAGGQDSGGGGGIIRQGRYLTFGTAKVKIDRPESQIPGMSLLQKVIEEVPLPRSYKGKIFEASLPMSDRKYFKIAHDDLTPEVRKQLIHEYSKALKGQIREEDLVVYAVTVEKITYILPEFFELKTEAEQAAILFHEAEWVLNPRLTYNEVIDYEIAFQTYVEKSNGTYVYEGELFNAFDRIFSNPLISIKAALLDDYTNHRLDWALSDDDREFVKWFTLLDSGIQFRDAGYSNKNIVSLDIDLLAGGLVKMMREHPDVRVFERIYVARKQLLITFEPGTFEQGALPITTPALGFRFNDPKGLDFPSLDLWTKTSGSYLKKGEIGYR